MGFNSLRRMFMSKYEADSGLGIRNLEIYIEGIRSYSRQSWKKDAKIFFGLSVDSLFTSYLTIWLVCYHLVRQPPCFKQLCYGDCCFGCLCWCRNYSQWDGSQAHGGTDLVACSLIFPQKHLVSLLFVLLPLVSVLP